MRLFSKLIAILSVMCFTCAAQAQALGNTYTYRGLAWDFTSTQTGFNTCTTLYLDATGDVYNSDNFTTYGQLYCPGLGSYSSAGSAYFDVNNNFNLTVEIGVAHKLVCNGLHGQSLGGPCQIYRNDGVQTGTAVITFL